MTEKFWVLASVMKGLPCVWYEVDTIEEGKKIIAQLAVHDAGGKVHYRILRKPDGEDYEYEFTLATK